MKLARPTKIIVVDDSATTRFLIKRGLESSGDFQILAMFESGEALLEEYENFEPDAVLMDIILRGELDGIETAERLQKIKSVPVIFTSIDDSQDTLERAMDVASFSFVLKPLSLRELRITIDFTVYQARAEEEFRNRDVLMSDILETINAGIIYLNNKGRISYCNQAARAIAGLDDGDFRTRIDEVLLFQDAVTRSPLNINPLLDRENENAVRRGNQLAIRRKDGEERIVSWELTPFSGHSGREGGWLMHLRDHTNEFKIGNQLEIAFRALENIEEGVAVTRPFSRTEDFSCLFCNPSFVRIFGLESSGDASPSCALQEAPAPLAEILPEVAYQLRGSQRFQKEIETDDAGHAKRHFIWTSVSVQEDRAEPMWLHTVSDITQMRQLEANFRQSQKLEAVGQLAGGIAHDFNNILSIINSYADLIQINFEESHPYYTYAKNISDSGRKGAALVAQLMSFSRRQDDATAATLDLVSAVSEIEDMLKRLIRESVLVHFHYDCDEAFILSNENMVEQILLNLMVNAQDAIPENGSIDVRVERMSFSSAPDGLGSENAGPGDYARLSVSDTGSGIPEDLQERIFEPFFTTKDVGKGTGLGLATVFGLVSDAGGIVQLVSSPGDGTTFNLLFPIAEAAESAPAPEAARAEPAPENASERKDPERTRILVVEDDEQFSNCIEGLLELHGFDVYRANNGKDALALGEDLLKSVDLLVSDLVMPHMSGMDLATAILEVNPGIKIIFMTGYSDTMPNREDYPEDMVLLRKPFSISLIIEHLGKLLGVRSGI